MISGLRALESISFEDGASLTATRGAGDRAFFVAYCLPLGLTDSNLNFEVENSCRHLFIGSPEVPSRLSSRF